MYNNLCAGSEFVFSGPTEKIVVIIVKFPENELSMLFLMKTSRVSRANDFPLCKQSKNLIIIIRTNSYIAHFTVTVSMRFALVPWSLGQ